MHIGNPSRGLSRNHSSGFTLVEMAVVVVLMGIMMTLGLRMLQATQNNAAWSETKLKQERIKAALVSFLRTNGRLPCPDSALPPTGAEPANCLVNAGRGVLPWQALGLSVGDVQDGWSNLFTYRVANRTPVTSSNWTIKAGLPAAAPFTITELTTPLTALTVQARSDAGVLGPALVPSPVVVILSHGKNGSGARTVRGAAVLPAPVGADEVSNSAAASTTFITRTPTDVAAATGGAYDDLVAHMSPKDLLQPLLDDKTLKGVDTSYRELAMAQLAVSSCTPPATLVAQPLINAISPSVGNGVITYSCLAGDFCNTATPVHSGPPITPGAQVLYRLSLFGAAAQPVTYAQLQAAYPAIQTRCP
jgi:prepilin-type N-terminal cleavage/methylation domain-containing protein